ncbi:MAG TPA: PLP-dependent aminotransferase family protein [Lysobacter sp.]
MEPISGLPGFELAIDLPPRGSRDLLHALHQQLRSAIVEGRLQPGLRLPPTRTLAAAVGVSRNTAVATYDLLLSEGYLVARHGAGTYVAQSLPQAPERKASTSANGGDRRLSPPWREPTATPSATPRKPPRYNFRLGLPDHAQFPFDVWRRLATRALRSIAKAPAEYASPQGQPSLRDAIARHVSFARAVACRADDLVVTTGAQQAFDLLGRILVTPRRTVVAMENPGYPPARTAFETAGARIVPVPVDEEGLRVDRLPEDARVIYVTPSHQSPLGCAMSMRRRAALLEFAQARGAVIIEDDYDGEFRFDGRPLDALQTLDRAGSVFYVGTFSKSLFPAIRLGYVVAPPWALAALIDAKQGADGRCDTLTQETLAAFIAEGHLARHVRKMRQVYGRRRQVLLDGLQEFGGWLQPVPSAAGLHLAAMFNPATPADAIAEQARQLDVGVQSLRMFYTGKPRPGLVFGYGTIGESAIAEGLARLRRLRPT